MMLRPTTEQRFGVLDLAGGDKALERSVDRFRHAGRPNRCAGGRVHVDHVRDGVLGDATDDDARDVVWPWLLVPKGALPLG
jgi:hypothetical protein